MQNVPSLPLERQVFEAHFDMASVRLSGSPH
jgi:hypothetical protein